MPRNRAPGGREGRPHKLTVPPQESLPLLAVPEYIAGEADTIYWFLRFGEMAVELRTLTRFKVDELVDMARCKCNVEELVKAKRKKGRSKAERLQASLASNLRQENAAMARYYQSFGFQGATVGKDASDKDVGYLESRLGEIDAAKVEADMKGWEPPTLKAEGQ